MDTVYIRGLYIFVLWIRIAAIIRATEDTRPQCILRAILDNYIWTCLVRSVIVPVFELILVRGRTLSFRALKTELFWGLLRLILWLTSAVCLIWTCYLFNFVSQGLCLFPSSIVFFPPEPSIADSFADYMNDLHRALCRWTFVTLLLAFVMSIQLLVEM
ncbi:uncharacterized protein LDX57_006881 [Aspergillus melleus]|uniref:uncharacterized protein n=1 Tax=Aspergillus melleus TaxID=138277 RepID=UPI001E8ED598|nr:uncharacterized protein LDX57_006881 [Aspergillus melleus]KAH8429214.1 hypothetical protein LDX57_006881 [Aspergillus melleus]